MADEQDGRKNKTEGTDGNKKDTGQQKRHRILELTGMLLVILLIAGGIYFLYRSDVYHDTRKQSVQKTVIHHYTEDSSVQESEDTSKAVYVQKEDRNILTYTQKDLLFELPVSGATGYAPCRTSIKDMQDGGSVLATMDPGDAFEILEGDDSGIWKVRYNKTEGWVDGNDCMINLPDVIPSIIYYDSNAVSSLFFSSGIRLPDITGSKLYTTSSDNDRFGTAQFNMPVFYGMALKIYAAQQEALKNGDCLMIYESFRPYETQQKVMSALDTLDRTNSTVHAGINSGSWNRSWFIAQSLSDHQRGVAIDTSLAKVTDWENRTTGDWDYAVVTKCSLGDIYSDGIPASHGKSALVSGKIEYRSDRACQMPTNIHELSIRACTFQYGVPSHSQTAWKQAKPSSAMTEYALRLQKYCTDAGLTPLSSEWWHFGDLDALQISESLGVNGSFMLKDNVSHAPQK